jgi:NitT/TauT family transport system permease protein
VSGAVVSGSPLEGEGRARRITVGRRGRQAVLVVVGWLAFLGFWTYASNNLVNPFILPTPAKVLEEMRLIVSSGELFEHFQWSLMKTFVGFGLAVAIGLPIGMLMGRSRWWRAFFHMPVTVAGNIPGITYAVLALVIFGISLQGPILAVAFISMPYIAINVAAGLDGIDRGLLQMSHAFGRRGRAILRHVLIPTVIPFVFAGVRLSFALAWKVEALTEVFGSSDGIGFMIRRSYQLYSVTDVLAWTGLFVIFMLLLERLVLVRLERYLFRWRPREAAA